MTSETPTAFITSTGLPPKLHRRVVKRIAGLVELLSTEESFVTDHLLPLLEIYIKPMVDKAKSLGIDLTFWTQVRTELEGALAVHRGMLAEFLAPKTWGTFSHAIISLVHEFSAAQKGQGPMPDYDTFAKTWNNDMSSFANVFVTFHKQILFITPFVIGFIDRNSKISKGMSSNSAFAKFIAQADAKSGMSFAWVFGRPLHRPTRYSLLWGAISKYTDESNLDHDSLQTALLASKEIGGKLQQHVLRAEADAAMQELVARFDEDNIPPWLLLSTRRILDLQEVEMLYHNFELPPEEGVSTNPCSEMLDRIKNSPKASNTGSSSLGPSGSSGGQTPHKRRLSTGNFATLRRRSVSATTSASLKAFSKGIDAKTTASDIFNTQSAHGFIALCNDGVMISQLEKRAFSSGYGKAINPIFCEAKHLNILPLSSDQSLFEMGSPAHLAIETLFAKATADQMAAASSSGSTSISDDSLTTTISTKSVSLSIPTLSLSSLSDVTGAPRLSISNLGQIKSDFIRIGENCEHVHIVDFIKNDQAWSKHAAFLDEDNKRIAILKFKTVPLATNFIQTLIDENKKRAGVWSIKRSIDRALSWTRRSVQVSQTTLDVQDLEDILISPRLRSPRANDDVNIHVLLVAPENCGINAFKHTFSNKSQVPQIIHRKVKLSNDRIVSCHLSSTRSLSPHACHPYYDSVIIMYSCISKDSLNAASQTIEAVKSSFLSEFNPQIPPIILVGSQKDQRPAKLEYKVDPSLSEEDNYTAFQQYVALKSSYAEFAYPDDAKTIAANCALHSEIDNTCADDVEGIMRQAILSAQEFHQELRNKPMMSIVRVLLVGGSNSGKAQIAFHMVHDRPPTPDETKALQKGRINSWNLKSHAAQHPTGIKITVIQGAKNLSDLRSHEYVTSDLVVFCISTNESKDVALVEQYFAPEFRLAMKNLKDDHHPPILIVGTKADLQPSSSTNDSFISDRMAQQLVRSINAVGYIPVSSATSYNTVPLKYLLTQLGKEEHSTSVEIASSSTTKTFGRKFGKFIGTVKTSSQKRKKIFETILTEADQLNKTAASLSQMRNS